MKNLKFKTIKGIQYQNEIVEEDTGEIYPVYSVALYKIYGFFTLKKDKNNENKYLIQKQIFTKIEGL